MTMTTKDIVGLTLFWVFWCVFVGFTGYSEGRKDGIREMVENPPHQLDYELYEGDTVWTSGRWQYRIACHGR